MHIKQIRKLPLRVLIDCFVTYGQQYPNVLSTRLTDKDIEEIVADYQEKYANTFRAQLQCEDSDGYHHAEIFNSEEI